MQKIHKHEPAAYTFKNTSNVSMFAMKSDDIIHFVENNPGMLMKSDKEF
jgi:hypothetical protein